jgi:hypothetical protein
MANPVTREGDTAVIRLPMTKVHSLTVALEVCPCRSPKSNSSAAIRKWLKTELQKLDAEAR